MDTIGNNETIQTTTDSSVSCKSVMASSTLTLVLILIMVLITVFAIYFLRYKVAIFSMFHARNWLPRKVIKTEDKKYDGFVCYDNADQALANEIAQQLEPTGSRLCIPSRDWATGGEFSRNIDNTMLNSWATLLLLTKNSAANIAFQEEFRNAYIKLKEDRTHRLVLVKSQDYEVTPGMIDDFLKLLRGKTVVVWGEKLFWEKLRYLVRRPELSSDKMEKKDAVKSATPLAASGDELGVSGKPEDATGDGSK